MEPWTFFGRILPERVPFTFDQPIGYDATVKEHGLAYRAAVNLREGQVIACVTVTAGDTDVHSLRNYLEADVRSIVDLVGYQRGLSFDVEIISAIADVSKSGLVFGTQIPALAQSRSITNEISNDLIIAVTANPSAKAVLANFREAMRMPVETGFFCYRAIEAMMQTMKVAPDESDGAGWSRLHANLKVDAAYIKAIKAQADDPRHGKVSAISDAARAEVFKWTDPIISRFLEFLVRERVPLDATQFPILTL
jgi:hypothetical protein